MDARLRWAGVHKKLQFGVDANSNNIYTVANREFKVDGHTTELVLRPNIVFALTIRKTAV